MKGDVRGLTNTFVCLFVNSCYKYPPNRTTRTPSWEGTEYQSDAKEKEGCNSRNSRNSSSSYCTTTRYSTTLTSKNATPNNHPVETTRPSCHCERFLGREHGHAHCAQEGEGQVESGHPQRQLHRAEGGERPEALPRQQHRRLRAPGNTRLP